MSLVPNGAACSRCRTPRPPGATVCQRCGYGPPVGQMISYAPPPQQQQPPPFYPPYPPQAPQAMYPHVMYPPMPPPQGMILVSAKSPGIAVLMSLWLGGGHLYIRQTAAGFVLMVFWAFLCIASWIPFAIFLTAPTWFIAFIASAISAAHGANEYNRRNGFIER